MLFLATIGKIGEYKQETREGEKAPRPMLGKKSSRLTTCLRFVLKKDAIHERDANAIDTDDDDQTRAPLFVMCLEYLAACLSGHDGFVIATLLGFIYKIYKYLFSLARLDPDPPTSESYPNKDLSLVTPHYHLRSCRGNARERNNDNNAWLRNRDRKEGCTVHYQSDRKDVH